jgi:two-component system NtrC family response regulator
MQMPDTLGGLITRDPHMLRICRTIEKVANTNASVMLLGESGTGKEVLARGLHQQSNRKDGKFVAINCAAIPENLLESELFGYEKGAFTGAAKTTPGKIETAHAGTLMLDEIGDMPMSLQAKLLRFLQERVVERIGGRQEIPVDVRVVCATHQNLTQCVKEGRFREDLYYRLAEIVVEIPPLRARVGDAALLAHTFVRRFGLEHRRNLTLADDALRAIEAHPWPGNIRELENCIKRATIMTDGNQITADDIGLAGAASAEGDRSLDLRVTREAAEQRAVLAALARADGTIAKAADLLGVSRPTLYDLMHRLGLKP